MAVNPFLPDGGFAPVAKIGNVVNPFLVPDLGQRKDNVKSPDGNKSSGAPLSAFDVDLDEGFVPAIGDSSFIDAYPTDNCHEMDIVSKRLLRMSNADPEPPIPEPLVPPTPAGPHETEEGEEEDEEGQEDTNPLFAVAGVSEARKKIQAVLDSHRKRRLEDTDNDPDSSPLGFRFCGSIQSDDEDEMEGISGETITKAALAVHRKELTLDTPPYMFFTPENRKQNKRQKNMVDAMPLEIKSSPGMKKYWVNRYQLFSRYDEGIKMDEESWFSVTPENIAIHIADRCSTDGIIIDAFCGCGGNTIQFAMKAAKVIAIDIDPVKIEYARHNARIYGVDDRITFVVADFMDLAPALKGDIVFLSPPWGGPEYAKADVFDLRTMIPMDGMRLFEVAEDISPNIAYYVPRNVNKDQLALLSGPGGAVEIESNFSGGHIKALTAYYGELIAQS